MEFLSPKIINFDIDCDLYLFNNLLEKSQFNCSYDHFIHFFDYLTLLFGQKVHFKLKFEFIQ